MNFASNMIYPYPLSRWDLSWNMTFTSDTPGSRVCRMHSSIEYYRSIIKRKKINLTTTLDKIVKDK